ncbi:MAG: coenzyme F420-0:L-glutamate ligase [Candidatus Staskawiczbacteria bacterium]|nr:coenzyme F420-0:L-glutamate ligase [Candidatus Staskawiczbacteria bacterium]MBI3337207.1 coenzyme F420-0:L-glutamate ligase [Candidatus Staskawiczbacteria bacterium]
MKVKSIKSRVFLPPKDDLFSLIKESFYGLKLKDKSIIVITSKIVAIWQGRCVRMDSVKRKDDLIKKEADFYIDRDKVPQGYVILTLKNNILIPTSGIDESNAKGHYILWPDNPNFAAKQIYQFVKKTYKLRKFGIIISDSHCTPLKNGVMGIAIGYYGFYPLRDYRGKKDIFGRKMKISQTNIADSVAAAAVLAMGEGKEQTPIAIVEDINLVKFGQFNKLSSDPLIIGKNQDIYAPLINSDKWKKGG